MGAPIGNINAQGHGNKIKGNTNALKHGHLTAIAKKKRITRTQFCRECRRLIEELNMLMRRIE